MAQSPCPHRIVDDMGYAFSMGCIGGGVWHAFKGWRNAPRGWGNRIRGSGKAISARAPVLGGNFAVWGLCFSSFDCLFLHIRRKDDPLNAISAGASTGALLAWRAGARSMVMAAAVGGTFLAIIEGLGILIQKTMAGDQNKQQGPISPYSTYKPAGPGRHVGSLDHNIDHHGDHDHHFNSNDITGNDNSKTWNITDTTTADDLGYSFDEFIEQPSFNNNNNNYTFDNQNNDATIKFGRGGGGGGYHDDEDDDED